jgi:predicted short-subunit dehydrogenase-like oxidoreductase (DUF2520 family)
VVNKKIVLVGAGNMATSLAMALKKSGNAPVAVWSRTESSAAQLGTLVGSPYSSDLASLPAADVVIISVVDSALREVAEKVAALYPSALILHTAGSIPMSALNEAGAARSGVFYPMQTMSKQNIVPFDNVTIFIEAGNEADKEYLCSLASLLSRKVVYATSEQRRSLHVAAVFACNFPNAVYNMAAEILERNGLPFDAMLPLIDEAARKVHLMTPLQAQTGPAKRKDYNVMDSHQAMLDDDLKEIYAKMSEYIMKRM